MKEEDQKFVNGMAFFISIAILLLIILITI